MTAADRALSAKCSPLTRLAAGYRRADLNAAAVARLPGPTAAKCVEPRPARRTAPQVGECPSPRVAEGDDCGQDHQRDGHPHRRYRDGDEQGEHERQTERQFAGVTTAERDVLAPHVVGTVD